MNKKYTYKALLPDYFKKLLKVKRLKFFKFEIKFSIILLKDFYNLDFYIF